MSHKKHHFRLFIIIFLTLSSFIVGIVTGFFIFTTPRQQRGVITEPQTTIPPPKEASFIVVGDIMLSRNVARHAEKSGRSGWIWENIRSFLHSADFVVGNLEGPTNGTEKYSYQKVMNFNALPHLIRELPGVNFAALSLANNHILDQDKEGIVATRKILSEISIKPFGAGITESEAWEPQIIEQDGIKIAFIGASYAAYNDNGQGIYAGVARMQDTPQLTLAVQKAKKEADFVVIMMHGGSEYTREPTKLQRDFAHTAIDAGADIVFGAHPHWVQGTELYQGKYIFYSLGNFIFDQEFSTETKTGLTVRVSLSKKDSVTSIDDLQLSPIIIENYGQPRLLDGEAKIKALKNMEQKKLGIERD